MNIEQYDAARSHAIIVNRIDRRYVRVFGRDPVRMVQGLLTNDIAGERAAGRAVYSAVLTPKGKMVADVRVLRRDAELLLDVAEGALDNMIAHLRKFVPPLFARFEPIDSWSCTGVYGVRAAGVIKECFGVDVATLGEDDVAYARVTDVDIVIVATSYAGVPGFDLVIPDAARDTFATALRSGHAMRADMDTLEVLRIEAGQPRWGAELDENTIPLEAGLRERAISENKGCYTGQEIIVRILHRGHVNWLLRGILLGDNAEPARDTAMFDSSGKKTGRITSAVYSPVHGQWYGLGYVRREVEPPARLQLGDPCGAPVQVISLAVQAGPPHA